MIFTWIYILPPKSFYENSNDDYMCLLNSSSKCFRLMGKMLLKYWANCFKVEAHRANNFLNLKTFQRSKGTWSSNSYSCPVVSFINLGWWTKTCVHFNKISSSTFQQWLLENDTPRGHSNYRTIKQIERRDHGNTLLLCFSKDIEICLKKILIS